MIQTWPIKRKTHLDREVVKALSDDLGLDAEAEARLRGVASHDDDDDGVLEEASIACRYKTQKSDRTGTYVCS